jgi:hypothetical protein
MSPENSSVWVLFNVLFSLLAGFGGAVVAWGLWLEFKGESDGEKKDVQGNEGYANLETYHAGKRIKKQGEICVIIGVLIEVVVAASLAFKDGCQAHSIIIQNANNDPRNQPLRSLTAVVTLVVLTGATREHPMADRIISSKGWNLLTLQMMANNGFRIELHQDTVPPSPIFGDVVNAEATTETIVLHLSGNEELQEPYMRKWNDLVGLTNLTAGQIADFDFTPKLEPTFLRGGTVVNAGEVRIWFNSPEIERRFLIPPQQVVEPPLSMLQCLSWPQPTNSTAPPKH